VRSSDPRTSWDAHAYDPNASRNRSDDRWSSADDPDNSWGGDPGRAAGGWDTARIPDSVPPAWNDYTAPGPPVPGRASVPAAHGSTTSAQHTASAAYDMIPPDGITSQAGPASPPGSGSPAAGVQAGPMQQATAPDPWAMPGTDSRGGREPWAMPGADPEGAPDSWATPDTGSKDAPAPWAPPGTSGSIGDGKPVRRSPKTALVAALVAAALGGAGLGAGVTAALSSDSSSSTPAGAPGQMGGVPGQNGQTQPNGNPAGRAAQPSTAANSGSGS
jgi:hypothetical protein